MPERHPRPLSRAQTTALAEQLRRALVAIDAGELTASTATRYRLEGAVSALDAVLGVSSTLLDGLDQPPT